MNQESVHGELGRCWTKDSQRFPMSPESETNIRCSTAERDESHKGTGAQL